MTMTLATARARLRFLTDDPVIPASSPVSGARLADTDLDDALQGAQAEAWGIAVSSGANVFQLEGQVTTDTTGLGDLSTLAPQRLSNVALLTGTIRMPIPPVLARDISQPYGIQSTLVVTYTPRVVFPSAPSNAFVWGIASINLPQLDKLMVAIAASELKIVDAEQLAGLETRKAELVKAVQGISLVPGWCVLPMSPMRQAYVRYAMTGSDQLQLVYA